MADSDTEDKSKRGLASASKKTREEVARLGGEAHHDKRGNHGTDNSTENKDSDSKAMSM